MHKNPLDIESEAVLRLLTAQQGLKQNRLPGVRSVLVVLSENGMVFDVPSLSQNIRLTYPEATVFFCTPKWIPLGSAPPRHVDLLIDFTSPFGHEKYFLAKKLRRMSRVAVGRGTGLLRRWLYDRLLNEKKLFLKFKENSLEMEREIQKEVLGLAGILIAQQGESASSKD
jgi:hypothetical protein